MKKISFDFDGTLTHKEVQEYAKSLINIGIDVWIVTKRYKNSDNSDLFELANYIGIKKENIVFTNGDWKCMYFKDHSDFEIHLDDDWQENLASKDECVCYFVQYTQRHSSWKKTINYLINN